LRSPIKRAEASNKPEYSKTKKGLSRNKNIDECGSDELKSRVAFHSSLRVHHFVVLLAK
jgi:hypothetical protein